MHVIGEDKVGVNFVPILQMRKIRVQSNSAFANKLSNQNAQLYLSEPQVQVASPPPLCLLVRGAGGGKHIETVHLLSEVAAVLMLSSESLWQLPGNSKNL